MKIGMAKPSTKAKQTIYLFQSLDQLNALALSKTEKDYVQEQLKSSGDVVLSLNRFPDSLLLVKPGKLKKEAYQRDEQVRLLGRKSLDVLKDQNEAKAIVKSLEPKLSEAAYAEGLALSAYRFLKYFSDKKKRSLKLKELLLSNVNQKECTQLNALIAGVYTARDLVNEPVNFLTATQLAKQAQLAGDKYGFKTEVLNKKRIESLKMGGLLAVNKGSQDPPTFTIMEYCPTDAINKSPIVLVGKGVVYDTGGLSLKPTAGSMDSMKSDMGGSAAVIGAMIAAADSKLPVHIIGLVPATDNRPGEKAYTPGDVIKMYDGSTVEVLNTDAEGRMILADALAYAKNYKPELVIDLATLTGAAAVAIGKYGVVAMGTAKDRAFDKLAKAGKDSYERIARFPFWEEYDELLKSPIADQKNIGGREAGAITAGKFLEKFTDYPWIHLDIAGPAFLDADHGYRLKGGTGVGVRLLFNYFKNLR
jgi:leucyl aminopeptidase